MVLGTLNTQTSRMASTGPLRLERGLARLHLRRPRWRVQFHCANSTSMEIVLYRYALTLHPSTSPRNVESTKFEESACNGENVLQD